MVEYILMAIDRRDEKIIVKAKAEERDEIYKEIVGFITWVQSVNIQITQENIAENFVYWHNIVKNST